eukprot:931231-Rhodomonas_salina.1
MSCCPIPPPRWRNGCRKRPESKHSGGTSQCPHRGTIRSNDDAAGASPTAAGPVPCRRTTRRP